MTALISLACSKNAGNERPAVGRLQRVLGTVECVGLALEQAHVGVHGRTGNSANGLGMNDARTPSLRAIALTT